MFRFGRGLNFYFLIQNLVFDEMHSSSSDSVTKLGDFLKFLVKKFLTKVVKILCEFMRYV